jgi:hypothetical protein
LWGDVVEKLKVVGFDKLKQPEVKPRIIYQDDSIGLKREDIFFAKLNIAKYSRQMPDHLDKTHKSQVSDMPDYMPSGSSHFIATPAPDISAWIFVSQRSDEVGSMQVSGCLARYDVVFHLWDGCGDLGCKGILNRHKNDRECYYDSGYDHASACIDIIPIDEKKKGTEV